MDKRGSSVEYVTDDVKSNKVCDVCLDAWKHDGGLMNKCETCRHLFCKKCPDHHKKFPTVREQQPNNDISELSYNENHSLSGQDACASHPEETTNMYCDEHKSMCCPVCVVEYHRDCVKIKNIFTASRGILPSDDYESFLDCIERRRRELKDTKHLVLSDIHRLACVKSDIIKEVEMYIEELIGTIQEMGVNSIQQIQERYATLVEDMNDTVITIDKLLQDAEVQLKEFKKDTEPEMFRRILNNASVCDIEDVVYHKIESFQGLSFSINKQLMDRLNEFDDLGHVNFPCEATLVKEFGLRNQTDQETCSITGMCLLDDNIVVMTDAFNGNLKSLDSKYNLIECLELSGEPTDVCQTKRDEIAVVLLDKKAVQFVTVRDDGSMDLAGSFDVGIPSRFISMFEDELYLSCGGLKDKLPGHIRKYDFTGNLVGKFEVDTFGQRLFSTPRHMTINALNGYICIADGDNEATAIDLNGFKQGSYQNSFLNKSVGAATIEQSKYLICGWGKHINVVQQIDERMRLVGSTLNSTHGIEMPTCIVYNKCRDELLVSSYSSDKFHVFKMH
ncbi:hypothetical protein ACF0H5_018237 [Mactra antiquata]